MIIDRLDAASSATVFNPYAGVDELSAMRRHNLSLYLRRMAERQPRLLLLGEAPGYRGCRVTGVPFTSESILLDEACSLGLFGAEAVAGVGRQQGFYDRLLCRVVDFGYKVIGLLLRNTHRTGQPDGPGATRAGRGHFA